jgi:Gram-negative bacterial TonB protein C-terminal
VAQIERFAGEQRKKPGLTRSYTMLARTVWIVLLLTTTGFAQKFPEIADVASVNVDARIPAPESFLLAGYENRTWTIVDVQPTSGVDTRVRLIRAYPACGTYRVHETDYVFENVSVADLGGKADLCVPDTVVSSQIRSFTKRKLEEPSQNGLRGTAAVCGTETVIHRLPSTSDLRYNALQHEAEGLLALWSLDEEIRGRYQREREKKETDPKPLTDEQEDRQTDAFLAKHAAIQIRNGDFDAVLPEGWDQSGRVRLSDVIPDPEVATAPEEDRGVIENIAGLGLEEFRPILYPPIARIAHIQGDVRVMVEVDPRSGAVVSATALSAHAILRMSATDAIKSWRFQHPYFGPNPLEVVVHYESLCPPLIETQQSGMSGTIKHPRKKKKTNKNGKTKI